VARVLDQHPATRGASLLFGFPEHVVTLRGGSRGSQTDLWAVLSTGETWASMAVEGKAREPFGETLEEWLREGSAGKRQRLEFLCETLGLPAAEPRGLRYQLFHRAASAVLEAQRIGARSAVVLVQNFFPDSTSWADFKAFVHALDGAACRDGICETTKAAGVERLLFAWADCPCVTDADLASLA
jgi:hypothetical protein